MKTRSRTVGPALAGACLALAVGGCDSLVDHVANGIEEDPNHKIDNLTEGERAQHRKLFVADLHTDTMLWNRDIIRENGRGHVDLPRMKAGNIRLQIFTAVTKTPPAKTETRKNAQGDESEFTCVYADDINLTGLLAVAQLRDPETWFDLEARALLQARRLQDFELESLRRHANDPGYPELRIIRTLDDLKYVMEHAGQERHVVGAMLGVEGVHWLGEDGLNEREIEAGVQRLYQAGFRLLAPTHRFHNGLGGSSEGCDPIKEEDYLTDAGGIVLRKAEALGMVIDLAHAHSKTIAKAQSIMAGPLFVSHTGTQEACRKYAPDCDVNRNLTDEDIVRLAQMGGVIGVGFWPQAVGPGVEPIVETMSHIATTLQEAKQAGKWSGDPCEHIAFGSDFDGAVSTPFDAAGLALLTRAMRARFANRDKAQDGTEAYAAVQCFDETNIRKIAGGNVCRVMAARLGAGGVGEPEAICQGVL